jgi:protein-S-isoprenylcysteine O-methyltransferase Ste14
MFLASNLILEYATSYEMPSTPLDYLGALVGTVGLLLCLLGMVVFRSPLKVLCLDPGTLAATGPYRWSRNPQYVGWFMLLLGFALNDWSWWSLVALTIVATYLHLLILIEEEHLNRIFGEQYAKYRGSVSRYFGRPHRQSPNDEH